MTINNINLNQNFSQGIDRELASFVPRDRDRQASWRARRKKASLNTEAALPRGAPNAAANCLRITMQRRSNKTNYNSHLLPRWRETSSRKIKTPWCSKNSTKISSQRSKSSLANNQSHTRSLKVESYILIPRINKDHEETSSRTWSSLKRNVHMRLISLCQRTQPRICRGQSTPTKGQSRRIRSRCRRQIKKIQFCLTKESWTRTRMKASRSSRRRWWPTSSSRWTKILK